MLQRVCPPVQPPVKIMSGGHGTRWGGGTNGKEKMGTKIGKRRARGEHGMSRPKAEPGSDARIRGPPPHSLLKSVGNQVLAEGTSGQMGTSTRSSKYLGHQDASTSTCQPGPFSTCPAPSCANRHPANSGGSTLQP